VSTGCREHAPVHIGGARRLAALLQRDAEIEASLHEIGRRFGGALEKRRRVGSAVRFDEQDARAVQRIRIARIE